MNELTLPKPVGKQHEWLASPASRKILRVGRRGGKTRFAFIAALDGHGPRTEIVEGPAGEVHSMPLFKGVLQGMDVVWIAQTYPNLSTVLWREEVIPRFASYPRAILNKQLHDVTIQGLGTLMLRSAEPKALDAVRGAGKNLGGVIIDEAAHLPLKNAIQNVILPALLDNDGWLIIMSTTNVGPDGDFDDEGRAMAPSYFNRLCEQIRAGKRTKTWVEFEGTAFDNPLITPEGIHELIAEYTEGSPALDQEVYAKLLQRSRGIALPHLGKRHLVEPFVPDTREWRHFAAFDWGYGHPWVFGWYAVDLEGRVVKRDTFSGREMLPWEIDKAVRAEGCDPSQIEVHAGGDCWRARRNARNAAGGEGPTVAEALGNLKWRIRPANDARVAGLNNMRAYTALPADETSVPRFTWMDTPGNSKSLLQCAAMTLNPDNIEDVEKVDADHAGRGGDDFYDENRYALMSRPINASDQRPKQATQSWSKETLEHEWRETHRVNAPRPVRTNDIPVEFLESVD